MQTRTAFIITIGDIIESRAPRRKRLPIDQSNHNGCSSSSSSSPSSPDSSSYVSALEDQQDVQPPNGRTNHAMKMKTRTLLATSGSLTNGSGSLTNGYNNGGLRNKGRLMSADHAYNNGPLSPRTRSSLKQEADDEVTFGSDFNAADSLASGNTAPPPAKKKRRSVNEKFLEDNSDYYGFQETVEARSQRQRHRSASHADGSNSNGGGGDSGLPVTKFALRRERTGSSSSGLTESKTRQRTSVGKTPPHVVDEDDNAVDVGSFDNGDHSDNDDDDDDHEDEGGRRKHATRKVSNASTSTLSMSNRKRRSELDKLLEAGSSSFHFETARETANRLGPIHVDVEDDSSHSVVSNHGAVGAGVHNRVDKEEDEVVEEEEEEQPAPVKKGATKKKLKLVKGKKAKNDNLLQTSTISPSKKRGNPEWTKKGKNGTLKKSPGRPPKHDFDRKPVVDSNQTDTKLTIDDFLPKKLFEDLDLRLDEVDGAEVDVDKLQFSFERTPLRESWFLTYSRQDQGEEILYFPEPKSFQLPYEMPISTFYPRKDGPGGRGDKKVRKFGAKSALTTEASSMIASLAASGTATPTEGYPESATPADDDPWAASTSAGFLKPLTRKKRGRPADPKNLASALRRTQALERAVAGGDSIDSITAKFGPKASAALREFARKSPRGHASTRSLISSGGELHDFGDSADDVTGLGENKSSSAPHLLDECSNDSTMSHFSLNASQSQQLHQHLDLDPNALDAFLREPDPDLAGGDVSACTSPVPGSSGSSGDAAAKLKSKHRSNSHHRHHHKHHRRSKDSKTSTVPMSEPMDRLVAYNVDEVLLDCLEEELPSVPIDGELPGSEPLELLANYSNCDAMQLSTSRKTRPRPFLRTPSTSSNASTATPLDTKDTKSHPASPRRERTSSSSAAAKKPRGKSPAKGRQVTATLVEVSEEDSADEYTSACETLSVASTSDNDEETNTKPKAKSKAKSPVRRRPVGGSKKKLITPRGRQNAVGRGGGRGGKVKAVPRRPIKPAILARKGSTGSSGGRLGRNASPAKSKKFLRQVKKKATAAKKKSDDDEVDDDDEDESEDETSGSDDRQVFRLSTSSARPLKLIVRKTTARRSPSRKAAATAAKRIKIRKQVEADSDDNDDDDEGVDEDEADGSDDEEENGDSDEAEDTDDEQGEDDDDEDDDDDDVVIIEPRESKRLKKSKKKVASPRRQLRKR